MGKAWFVVLAVMQGALSGAWAGPCGETVLSQNFDGFSGGYEHWSTGRGGCASSCICGICDTGCKLELFPGFLEQGSSTMGRLQVGEGQAQMEMKQGCVGARTIPDDGVECGLLMQNELARPVTEATLTYNIRFSEGYDWTAGGKLPGLCSDDCQAGCQREGNIGHDEGWSNRLMFREGGNIVSYTYYPGQEDCGVDLPWGATLTPGEWYELKVYIQLNDPGAANGSQRAWVNGNLVWEQSGMTYRNVDQWQISRFVWQTFHGGNPNSPTGHKFAPSHNQTIWFDNFLVQEGECGPGSISTLLPADSPTAAAPATPTGFEQEPGLPQPAFPTADPSFPSEPEQPSFPTAPSFPTPSFPTDSDGSGDVTEGDPDSDSDSSSYDNEYDAAPEQYEYSEYSDDESGGDHGGDSHGDDGYSIGFGFQAPPGEDGAPGQHPGGDGGHGGDGVAGGSGGDGGDGADGDGDTDLDTFDTYDLFEASDAYDSSYSHDEDSGSTAGASAAADGDFTSTETSSSTGEDGSSSTATATAVSGDDAPEFIKFGGESGEDGGTPHPNDGDEGNEGNEGRRLRGTGMIMNHNS